jgi:predicted amidophosphoribosyltransferase
MFCPKCGKPMDLADGTYRCSPGHMPLSKDLHNRLTEVFVDRSRSARAIKLSWGGGWYCPGCGTPASVNGDHVECDRCGEYLDEFLSALIERHPHRRSDGQGWE